MKCDRCDEEAHLTYGDDPPWQGGWTKLCWLCHAQACRMSGYLPPFEWLPGWDEERSGREAWATLEREREANDASR